MGCGAPPSPLPCKAQAPLIPSTPRYTGHKNQEYKLDCCLSERDTHVVSCSEDGKVFFWDLVEVSLSTPHCTLSPLPLPQSFPDLEKGVLLGQWPEEGEGRKGIPAKGTVCAKASKCGT